ncbi:hypothetical protein [Laspinema olomoucense]|uniref:Uncharacterized protein n=1 Tax=Laspinema olomoucense D3b TaxID=2953688 RepID=A0ABT2NB85_9CYAN|nr:hypothetical protein [Laspinema sp. D3b]MCT7979817.1 hypothetical protein [Laspinema sp. D3b]
MWKEHFILVDGYQRYAICSSYQILYRVVELPFGDRSEVKAWIIANQLSKRNLTPEAVSYLRGTWYELNKRSHGGARFSSAHFEHLKTSEELAKRFKTSSATIRRDAQFASSVDAIAQAAGDSARTAILTRTKRLSKKEVISLAHTAQRNPQAVRDFFKSGQPEQNLSPFCVKPALHIQLKSGGLVEVSAPEDDKIDGRTGRVHKVSEKTAEVWLRDIQTMTMQLHTFKHSSLISIPTDERPALVEINARINRLYDLAELDPFEREILNLLERQVSYTPTELEYLKLIEQKYSDSCKKTSFHRSEHELD